MGISEETESPRRGLAAGEIPQDREVLSALFEAQADARPEALAVLSGANRATYADLEKGANRIARHLQSRGVVRGSLVAVLLPRSVDLYAAILGILKAGSAYVPIDVSSPRDRVEFILRDSGAKALVTTEAMARGVAFAGAVLRVDADRAVIQAASGERLPRELGASPGDLCYVIYTSGSTGRPKGVMIEHRNACHLVRVEGALYGVRPDDRVYQGASPSFDLSVEEMWLAFHAGATLVAATPEMAQAGPDLSKLLAAQRVTVLSTVPTLLSMLEEDVPTVRLLILGGEACPPDIVERWHRTGRRILNTYGPTETTVIATVAEMLPGEKVTIGRAIPGYRVDLRDETLRQVPRGQVGEICIAGVGVARGYVGLPEATRERFVPDPDAAANPEARMYRTGDLARMDDEGNLEFMGRADGQVKIRGYRVELGEIESVLLTLEGVQAAACALRRDMPGSPRLVGYVVPTDGTTVDESGLLAQIRGLLPTFMVPSQIETVASLPQLPSGKLDRAALPAPKARTSRRATPAVTDERTATQKRIADVWGRLFQPLEVSVDDDFFLDLGGHSLLAAQAVSALRKETGLESVSVSDVYEHPTIRALAKAIDVRRRETPPARRSARAPTPDETPRERRRRFLAAILQGVSLYGVFATRCLAWITPYLLFFYLLAGGHSLLFSAAWAIVGGVAVLPALVLIAAAAKWLVLGRVRPGRYPLWGGYHLRFWFAQAVVNALPLNLMTGTPLLPAIYRFLGARIGKDVFLGTDRIGAFDVVSIGEGSSLNELASVNGYTIEDGDLVIGPVKIGRDCSVGTWSVLGPGCEMGDRSRLGDLSLLPEGTVVPCGEAWSGSPAKRTGASEKVSPPPVRRGWLRRAATAAAYALLIAVYPILFFLAILPAMVFLTPTGLFVHPLPYLLGAPLVGGLFVAVFAALTIVAKRAILGRVRAGRYPLHGGFYIRYWFVDHLLKDTLEFMGQVYATLYVRPWYRALGARIGRNAELSTAASVTPDLLVLEEGSTVADEVSLGAPRVDGGWITLAPTRLGRRAFIGNSGVVPAGTNLGDGSLIGVLSVAPADPQEAAREGASWLGSPPILLPQRQPSESFPEARTFSPRRRQRIARGLFELLRVTWPAAGLFLLASVVTAATLALIPVLGLPLTLLAVPAVYGASCLAAAVTVAALKWVVVGRYRPFTHPLWSHHVWRLELVNALYEFFAAPLALEALTGTAFLPAYLRLLGAKIGRGTYMETTGLLEWDLVEIGDRSVLMQDVVVQTHLFEDRVLKASRLRIGKGCSIGDASVILYDSNLEDGCRLDALSLVMKGETLPAGTAWGGVPAAWQGLAAARGEGAAPTPISVASGKARGRPAPRWSRRPPNADHVATQGGEE